MQWHNVESIYILYRNFQVMNESKSCLTTLKSKESRYEEILKRARAE